MRIATSLHHLRPGWNGCFLGHKTNSTVTPRSCDSYVAASAGRCRYRNRAATVVKAAAQDPQIPDPQPPVNPKPTSSKRNKPSQTTSSQATPPTAAEPPTAAAALEAAAAAASEAVQSAAVAADDAFIAASSAADAAADAASDMVFVAADMASDLAQSASNGTAFINSSSRAAGASGNSNSSSSFGSRGAGGVNPAIKTMEADEEEVQALQMKLLAAVSSLDRGLAANAKEARDVDDIAGQLERLEGPVNLDWKTSRSSPDTSPMDRLAGTWRLIYSSGFNSGSLGGSRPGPPAAFVPLILGQVYQVIDAQQGRLNNVVELLANIGLPRLPFLPVPTEPQMIPGLRVTLGHSCTVQGTADVRIVYDSTAAKVIGPELLEGLPKLQVPELPEFLRPPADFRAATFTVTFLDDMMRITRGDRGELRIYLKDTDLDPSAPADYVD